MEEDLVLDIPEYNTIGKDNVDDTITLDIPEMDAEPAMVLDIPEMADTTEEFKPEAERSWLTKVIPRSKLTELANKYGKKEEDIADLLNMKGAIYESEQDLKLAEAAGDNPVAQALATVASTGESIQNIIPGMADSIAVGIPWKLRREASATPQLFDEIDRLAVENKGMLQSISEGLVEAGATGGIGEFALAKTGITAAAAKASAKFKSVIASALGGGKVAGGASKLGSAAIQLAPSAVTSGAVGATVGYGGARRGEEAESMRNFGALFAAMPYAGVGGAKALAYVAKWPTGKIAKALGIGVEEALADFGAIEAKVVARAPTESLMLDVAQGTKKITDLTDAELDQAVSALGKSVKNIKNITRELKDEGYAGDIVRRAKEIASETAINKKLLNFTEEFIPLRTAVDKSEFAIGDTINEFSQITELSEMKRWIRLNGNMDKGIKDRLTGTINGYMDKARGTIAEDTAMLSKIKDSLATEWLEPMTKALQGAKEEGVPTAVKFSSMSDVRKYLGEVNRSFGDDPNYLNKLWLNFRSAEEVKEKISSRAINYAYHPIERLVNWITPRQFTLDSIDRRFGTGLALPHQRIMKKLDSFKFVADGLKKETLEPLVKDYNDFLKSVPEKVRDERLFMHAQEGHGRLFLIRAKELGLFAGDIPGGKKPFDINEAMKLAGLDDKTAQTFKEFSATYKTATENLRAIANERFGIKIPEVKNYFRHQVVSSDVAYGRIINLFEKIKGNIPENMSLKDHRKLLRKDYNYRQLYLGMKALYQMGDGVLEKKFGSAALDEAVAQLEHLTTSQLSTRMGPNIYSAYRRTGSMPDILRETDPIKVLESWVNNTIRGKFIREDLADISKYIPVLEKAGAKDDSAFLKDYVRNLMGGKVDVFGSQNSRMRRVKDLAREYATKPGDWEKMVTVPEQTQSILARLMQTNLLSSPFTAIRNLEQIPFLTATEIGGSYGQYATSKGILEMLMDVKRRGGNIDDLYFQGKVPNQSQSIIHSEMLRPKTKLDKTEKASQWYADAVMFIFGKAEVANRLTTIGTARTIARDIASGSSMSADAMKFVNSISSPALRKNLQKKANAIIELRTSGAKKSSLLAATEDFKSDMEDYLLERTQFHYSKGNISRAAELLGPLFATFTRYTTEIQGDIVGKLRDGKNKEMLEKYLYPALYATMFMKGLDKATEDSKAWKNRTEAVFGKNVLAHAPGAGAFGMFSLLDQPAPVLSTVKDIVKAVGSGSGRDITKAINDTLSFVPLYKPVENWVTKFGYRAIGGQETSPFTEAFKDTRKAVVDVLRRDGKE